MRNIWVLFFLFCVEAAVSQPTYYTIANTHSHNDYEQRIPFWTAYNAGFGSIEADIWLRPGKPLLIGHDTNEIKSGRTLEEYYIRPLDSCMKKNNGHPYPDAVRDLVLLIDIKTDSIGTLDALIALLKKYPSLTGSASLKWAITGNRPASSLFTSYPSFIWFDGVLHEEYDRQALGRICMLSDDFKYYSRWTGREELPDSDWQRLQQAVAKSHQLHKPVRLWRAPDFTEAWRRLIRLQVDYINTDHIPELAAFLKGLPPTAL